MRQMRRMVSPTWRSTWSAAMAMETDDFDPTSIAVSSTGDDIYFADKSKGSVYKYATQVQNRIAGDPSESVSASPDESASESASASPSESVSESISASPS